MKSYFIVMNPYTRETLPVCKVATRAELTADLPPRLFNKRQHAANALACWREGRWINRIDEYGDGDGPQPSSASYNVSIREARKALYLDIVEVTLDFVPAGRER